jgi:hypothetical protein
MSVRSIRLSLLALLALGAAAPAGASAATLKLDHPCYVSEGTVREAIKIVGSGFTPGATVSVAINGKVLDTGAAGLDGSIAGTFQAPVITTNQAAASMTATDGTNTATVKFLATRVRAVLAPDQGAPSSWRARFTIYGFGALRAGLHLSRKSELFAHWFKPGGRLAGTSALGRLTGACGKAVSVRRKVLPFGTAFGTWRIQFDTNAAYKKSDKVFVERKVGVKLVRRF